MWLITLSALLPALGAILWYWGGCGERCHPGLPPLNKSWRRHVWPAVIGLTLWLAHFSLLIVGAVTVLAVLANTLGYGEDKRWWERIVVALSLGVPFMLLPILPLWAPPLLTLVVFIPLYILSLRHNWMTWGVVEAAIGATQGALLLTNIAALLGYRFALNILLGV